MDPRLDLRLLRYWEQCQRLREEERRSLQGLDDLPARKVAPGGTTDRHRTAGARSLPQLVDLRD
jgi:hypothetical protein